MLREAPNAAAAPTLTRSTQVDPSQYPRRAGVEDMEAVGTVIEGQQILPGELEGRAGKQALTQAHTLTSPL